jgi:hypothetical protein
MTQDEIIEMYLEVSNKLCNGTEWCWAGIGEPLQLFAKLVAAKERVACFDAAYDAYATTAVLEAIHARGEA